MSSLRGTTRQNAVASVAIAFVVAVNVFLVVHDGSSIVYAAFHILWAIGLLVGIRIFFTQVVGASHLASTKKQPK